MCVCVCLDHRIYGEKEKGRRRNGNFRGGETVLTLSCCQMQGWKVKER